MAQPSGTLGSRLYISDDPVTETTDDEAGFAALAYTEVGLIETFGEFGRLFDLATFQAVKDGRTYKLKAGFNDGSFQLGLGQDLSDDGQLLLRDAANASTQDNWAIRIDLNDAPSSLGGPTRFYFRSLPMSFRSVMGAANSVIKATTNIEVNSDIIHAPPAELYDLFVNGGSLAHYELFNGSDAEAVDPVISGNALSAVTGNASSGDFADNGTQAIGDTGYTLSGGPVVIEAKVKVSAITNVALFFGLTDQKAALEIPIESAGSSDDITTNATDAVGFMFDTRMSTDNIWLVGVNNDVDETAQDAGSAFVADTYALLRIEVAANGDAAFYIDGTQVGTTMTTACRTSVPLYPTIAAAARSTTSRTATVDYLYLRQD